MGIWNRFSRSKRAAAGLAMAGMMALTAVSGSGLGSARAQSATPAAGLSTATISVNGNGTVSMAPDTASVTLGVNISKPTLQAAQATATQHMNAIIAELKAQGIDEKDIQTTNFSVSVNQSYDANGAPGEVTGYTVNNQVTVTVRKLADLGALLDNVVEKGANAIWGINFYVADQTAAAKQARVLAVQDATQHAQELAAAAGGTLGKIVSIVETYSASPSPVAYDQSMAAGKSAVPIQRGSTTIAASVTIVFEFVQ